MISNVILSEIESFYEIFDEVISLMFEEEMKVVSSVLISPDTKEFMLEMNLDLMPRLKELTLKDDFKSYRHLTLNDSILLCPLKDDDKKENEAIFEFFVVVYSKNNVLQGVIYGGVDSLYQEKLINHLNNRLILTLLENTIMLLSQKFASYNRLFFSVNKYLELLSVKDKAMPYHMTNVANLCLDMSKRAKLSVLDTSKLYIAALLHDIGKLYIEDDIINNENKYSFTEFEIVKSHSQKGYEMAKSELSDLPLLSDVPNIIRCHHEWYDGSGYPLGIIGDDIPYLSRILTIADSIDAMLTHRTYKKQKDRNVVMKELMDCSGKQYDPKLVKIAVDVLRASSIHYDIEDVVGNNYIHNVSLAYYYDDFNKTETINGSLVLHESLGNFMLDESFGHIVHKMQGAKICFFYLNDVYEYAVDIERQVGNQLILKNFNFSPLEKYFSIAWPLKTSLFYPNSRRWDAKVIKIGSSSLVFEVNSKIKEDFLAYKNQMLTVPVHLKIDEFNEFVEVECRVMQHFEFENKMVVFTKTIGVKDNKKEKLVRALFKKQIFDRRIL